MLALEVETPCQPATRSRLDALIRDHEVLTASQEDAVTAADGGILGLVRKARLIEAIAQVNESSASLTASNRAFIES